MTDFNILNKALKAAWTPRIRSGNVASCKIIPNATLERYGRLQFLTNSNYEINTIQVGNLPLFLCRRTKTMTND